MIPGCSVQDLEKIFPVVIEGGSDSAVFETSWNSLHMTGRPWPMPC